jgi:hypothetical protein
MALVLLRMTPGSSKAVSFPALNHSRHSGRSLLRRLPRERSTRPTRGDWTRREGSQKATALVRDELREGFTDLDSHNGSPQAERFGGNPAAAAVHAVRGSLRLCLFVAMPKPSIPTGSAQDIQARDAPLYSCCTIFATDGEACGPRSLFQTLSRLVICCSCCPTAAAQAASSHVSSTCECGVVIDSALSETAPNAVSTVALFKKCALRARRNHQAAVTVPAPRHRHVRQLYPVVAIPSVPGTTGKRIDRGRPTYIILFDATLDMFVSVLVKLVKSNRSNKPSALARTASLGFRCGTCRAAPYTRGGMCAHERGAQLALNESDLQSPETSTDPSQALDASLHTSTYSDSSERGI